VKVELRHFDVCPKVVRAGTEAEITIRPLAGRQRFDDASGWEVVVRRCEAVPDYTDPPAALACRDGALVVKAAFEGEQEHTLVVRPKGVEDAKPIGKFSVYSVADDLMPLRPWKGDMHLHSFCSDGKDSPGHVAAACRRIGLDFMALTDHHRYAPSLEGIAAFEGVRTDLRMYPGEEVHAPDNSTHIINFGGSFSVNERCADEKAYRAEVAEIERTLTGLNDKARFRYASCLWCYRQIAKGGGLSIFCHPYWIWCDRFNVAEAVIERHFAEMPFDAYEVIGGFGFDTVEANFLQVARYYHEQARGRRIPVVGVSDAHSCETDHLFGWYYTIVLAMAPDFVDLVEAIRDCRSVAVEAMPGTPVRAHGPFRLVKYVHFLLREVLPLHDELCVEEGRLMLAHLSGDGEAPGELARLSGRTSRLYERLWGGGKTVSE